MKRILAILVDAFRYDYLSKRDTPFLYELSRGCFCAPLRPVLGYSDAIRATIYTGAYPDEHNYWMAYRYSPETSPFKPYSRFGFIEHAPHSVRPWLKLALSKVIRQGAIHNLPPRIAPLFDYTMHHDATSPGAFGDIPTIFDVFRDSGLPFTHIASDRFGQFYFWFARSIQKKLPQAIERINPETQFIFLFLHYLDNAGHRYGTKSKMFRRELREVDLLIKNSVEKVQGIFGEIEIMIFSDHGMADAREYINFDELAKNSGFGKDFFFITDSTMVRVWYLNERRRDGIRALVASSNCGHFLSAQERVELHLDFKHRYYGDDIYLVNPPYNIFPNSTSLLKPCAMHAYHPNLDSQRGIAMFKGQMLNKAKPKGDYVYLVDLMPTMLKVLKLNIPPTCKGAPLV